jgi:serine O-acetyltransferase
MNIKYLRLLLSDDLSRLSSKAYVDGITSVKWIKLFHPRFTPVLLIRLARFCYLTNWLRPLSFIFTWLNVFLFGIECTAKCDIGPGLFLPHTIGTVIGASKIGRNATIFQGVTLGSVELDNGFDLRLRPILGDNVVAGAGAKIIGGIFIGNNVKIGANAVVLRSFPAEAVVTGIPAKAVKK